MNSFMPAFVLLLFASTPAIAQADFQSYRLQGGFGAVVEQVPHSMRQGQGVDEVASGVSVLNNDLLYNEMAEEVLEGLGAKPVDLSQGEVSWESLKNLPISA